jgi:hypothetical protein
MTPSIVGRQVEGDFARKLPTVRLPLRHDGGFPFLCRDNSRTVRVF